MAAMQVPGPSRTTKVIATMCPWNKDALKSMRQELGRVKIDVVMIKKLEKSDVPSRANLGFLSREQLQVVEAEKTPAEQMNKVIDYLLEMEDKYFENFCHILEQSNFVLKAKMLREKDLKRFIESQLASSLEVFSASPLKNEAEGGSDPSEREDTSNLLTDEAALKGLCWIPFDIKTVSIEAKGGILCLEPMSDDLQEMMEDTIFVEVPPDAVSTSAIVEMRYAIIPSGPFTLPEGYQFGSPVVYIYYDGRLVTKPLALHLPHWYGGEDHARDGLSFAIAPHFLKGRSVYHFQLLAGGKFPVTSRYGVIEIAGHCSLFTTAFETGATVNCQAFSLIKENEEETECKAVCSIAVTNAAYCWRRILLENRLGWQVLQPEVFQFKSDRITATLKEKSHVHGDWKAYFIGASELLSSDVRYDVFGIHSALLLEYAVKSYSYPPTIQYIIEYKKELRRTGRSTEVILHVSGMDKEMDFPYKAYERIQATFAQVIQDHTEEFLQEMNAKEIAPKLKEYKLIPEPVEFDILQSKSKELANICLLRHLKEDAAEEAAMKVFRIASEMTSYGKMNTFAAGVLRKLQRDLVTDKQEMEEAQARATPDFRTSFEAALDKGAVEVEMVKCVTLGPPEAGKTQLKSALINKFDRSSESSPVSTGSEVVVQRYVSAKSMWEPLTRERLLKSLNTTVKEITESTEANSSTQKNEAQAVGVGRKKVKPPEDTTGASGQRADSKEALRSQFATIKASVEEELREAGTAEVKSLDKVRIIHMVDSGGQPAFFDIHPVIATSRAVYLLVYNMEEGLDHKPAITYRKKAFPTKQLQNTKQSNVDMIKDSLLTLHDCKQKFTALERELHHWFGDSISESADELPVLVVGTRKRKESIEREGKKLANKCSYLPLWKNVLHSTNTGTKLFAVESTDPECEGVQSVREEVGRAGCNFKLPLPISWFLCQLIFLSVNENLHVLTFSNLQDLCLQEGLNSDPDEFLAMVRTFHLLGIFSFPYLDQELTLRNQWRPDDKPVFTNPDVLYQQVTKILEVAYCDLAKTVMEPKARRSLTALQSNGQLDSDTLSYLGIPDDLGFYSGFHAYLLERLVQWELAAKPTTKISEGAAVTGRAAFFIPSVLPACDKEPVTCSESPLSFTFCLPLPDNSEVNYVPRGIFPHLIVHIEGQGYKIHKNTHYQSLLFRDVATFGIEPSHSNKMQYAYNVMVVDKMDHVTIAIEPAQEGKLSTADCRQIVSDFKQAMESVFKAIYQVTHAVTVASDCTCDKQLPSHLAKVIRCENGGYAMRCLFPGKIKRFDCPPEIAELLCDQAPVPHPPPVMTRPHPMAKQQPTVPPHNQHTIVAQIIQDHAEKFLEEMNSAVLAPQLKVLGLIPETVESKVLQSKNKKDANAHLLNHLKADADEESVMEVFRIASKEEGYGRMKAFAAGMLRQLQQGS